MDKIVCERLSQLIKELGTNNNRLAKQMGYANSVIGNVTGGRNLPSFDFLLRLKNAVSNVNMNWFICGEGPVFNTLTPENKVDVSVYIDLAATLKRENDLLREKIMLLEQSNDCNNTNKNKKAI